MWSNETVVAVFPTHVGAERAVRKLADEGFDMKNLSLIGKGYHTEEKVVGFYKAGDRIRFWGAQGALWGGLWGLFFGGIFLTVPLFGPVIVLGYLAAAALSAVEGAVVIGGLSAIGAALYSIGIPKESIIHYESALKADAFLVMAHGPAEELARARSILSGEAPSQVDAHPAAIRAEAEPA